MNPGAHRGFSLPVRDADIAGHAIMSLTRERLLATERIARTIQTDHRKAARRKLAAHFLTEQSLRTSFFTVKNYVPSTGYWGATVAPLTNASRETRNQHVRTQRPRRFLYKFVVREIHSFHGVVIRMGLSVERRRRPRSQHANRNERGDHAKQVNADFSSVCIRSENATDEIRVSSSRGSRIPDWGRIVHDNWWFVLREARITH
jgi:hypothetical protein